MLYPDAQLDIEDANGVSGRVNVEIVSDHYHATHDRDVTLPV